MVAAEECPPAPGGRVVVRLLGQLAVVRRREVQLVGGHQQRVILALLAMAEGRVLTADELIDRAWGGVAPATATAALRVHLARLRSMLSTGSGNPVLHTGVGYLLDPNLVETDVRRLDDLVRSSRSPGLSSRSRLEIVDEALALWDGDPLGGVRDDDGLRIDAERLCELRLELEEDRIDLLLAQGQHFDAAAAASVSVARQPLRERRTRQLMVALYRSGRQADALTAFGRLRDALVDQLAVEPGPETRLLEGRILRQETSLSHVPEPDGRSVAWAPREREVLRDVAHEQVRPSQMIRSLAAERMSALSHDAVRLVRLAAILDDLALSEVLAEAMQVSGERLLQLAAEAGEAGLLGSMRPGESCVVPRRELREGVLAEMGSAEDERRLRLRASAAITSTLPDSGPVRVAAAWQVLLGDGSAGGGGGGPGTRPEEVGPLVCRAVDSCLSSGRTELARTLCDRALRRADLSLSSRVDLTTRLFAVLSQLGDTEGADEVWRHGVEKARALDDAERFALMVLGHDRERRSLLAGAGEGALLREALERLGPRPSALRVRVAAALLMELMVPGRAGHFTDLAREVQASALEVGDEESYRSAGYARHVSLRATPDRVARRRVSQDLWRVTGPGAGPRWQAHALVSMIYDDFVDGAHLHAATLVDDLQRCAQESASPRLSWHHALVRAALARDSGEFDDADRWSDEAMVQGAAAGLPDALAAGALHGLLVAFHRDSLAGLVPLLQQYRADRPDNALIDSALALAHAHAHDRPASRSCAEMAMETLRRLEAPDELTLMALSFLAESELAARLPVLTEEVGARMAPYSGQFVTFGQVSGTFGPVDRLLGWVAWQRGDHPRAMSLLEAAERAARSAGTTPWSVRCGADLVRLLRSAGETERARAVAAHHLAAARALDLGPCVRELTFE